MNIELLLCRGKFQVALLPSVSIIILRFSYQIQVFLSEGIAENKDFSIQGQCFHHIEPSKLFSTVNRSTGSYVMGGKALPELVRATYYSVRVILVKGCHCMSENQVTSQEALSMYLKALSRHSE